MDRPRAADKAELRPPATPLQRQPFEFCAPAAAAGGGSAAAAAVAHAPGSSSSSSSSSAPKQQQQKEEQQQEGKQAERGRLPQQSCTARPAVQHQQRGVGRPAGKDKTLGGRLLRLMYGSSSSSGGPGGGGSMHQEL